jgi:hypothetical protein
VEAGSEREAGLDIHAWAPDNGVLVGAEVRPQAGISARAGPRLRHIAARLPAGLPGFAYPSLQVYHAHPT